MATPPNSPGPEEALFEFENAVRHNQCRPVAIEELLSQTKFTRSEIQHMYRGFKQVICNDDKTFHYATIIKCKESLFPGLSYIVHSSQHKSFDLPFCDELE